MAPQGHRDHLVVSRPWMPWLEDKASAPQTAPPAPPAAAPSELARRAQTNALARVDQGGTVITPRLALLYTRNLDG
jgi:hypothetical protein